jgi:hypothetical protein
MFHYVYRIDEVTTGNFYFGSRSCKCEPIDDYYMGSMCKWKPDKTKLLKVIIKDDFVDRESALIFERNIILENTANTLNKNYNIPSESGKMGCLPGEKNAFYGKKHTKETKERWKITRKNLQLGDKNNMWGKHFSDESKKKMREKKLGLYNGSNNPRSRQIYQYSINGTFIKRWDCATDCVNHYEKEGIKLSRGNISALAKHNDIETNTVKRLSKFIFSFKEINIERIKERYKNILINEN